jgi:tetratricopeptide (TPR) repeat protein
MNFERTLQSARKAGLRVCSFLGLVTLVTVSLGHPGVIFAQVQTADPDFEQKRTLAEGYHDLAILYIKKGDLDMAMASARQIIQLRFPAEQEYKIAQSLSIITEKLAEVHRFDLAQALLDEAIKFTEIDANKAKLFKTRARLYMQSGENAKAIDAWKRAMDLEARRIR